MTIAEGAGSSVDVTLASAFRERRGRPFRGGLLRGSGSPVRRAAGRTPHRLENGRVARRRARERSRRGVRVFAPAVARGASRQARFAQCRGRQNHSATGRARRIRFPDTTRRSSGFPGTLRGATARRALLRPLPPIDGCSGQRSSHRRREEPRSRTRGSAFGYDNAMRYGGVEPVAGQSRCAAEPMRGRAHAAQSRPLRSIPRLPQCSPACVAKCAKSHCSFRVRMTALNRTWWSSGRI